MTKVVATTPQLADIARNVVGEDVEVETLLDGDVDPHDYEPRPSDAKALAEADVVLRSGGEVDAWLGDLVDSAGVAEDRVIDVGEAIGQDSDDPHWWQDPRERRRGREGHERRSATGRGPPPTADEVRGARRARSTRACARSRASGASSSRTTTPSGTSPTGTGSRSSARSSPAARPPPSRRRATSRELVAAIRREGVTTIFPESALRQDLEEAVARDAGARVGEPLYADTLGPSGTYLGALRHDAAAMARGFGGDCLWLTACGRRARGRLARRRPRPRCALEVAAGSARVPLSRTR